MLRRVLALALLLSGCADGVGVWSVAVEEPHAALLAVHATDHGVYVVGIDDGLGPAVLRGRDGAWEHLHTGDRGDLWWVAPDVDETLLLAGEGGRILAYDPTSAAFESYVTPTTDTVFGLWVAPDGTAWAAAGDVLAESARGELWVRREPGEPFVRDERVSEDLLSGVLFKVWGTASDDVWAVGEGGLVLHFDGVAWTREESPVSVRLVTVHGQPGLGPMVVGGASNGVLLERGDAGFVNEMPEFMPGANGVWVEPSGSAWAVGNRGTVLSLDGSGQWQVDEEIPTDRDLHAVTVDRDGVVWAVGGALFSPQLDRGVVIRLDR